MIAYGVDYILGAYTLLHYFSPIGWSIYGQENLGGFFISVVIYTEKEANRMCFCVQLFSIKFCLFEVAFCIF